MAKPTNGKEVCVFDFKHDTVHISLVDRSTARPKVKESVSVSLAELLNPSEDTRKKLASFSYKKEAKPAVLTWESGITFRQVVLPDLPAQDLERVFLAEMKNKYSFSPAESLYARDCVAEYEAEDGAREKIYSFFYCDKKSAMEKIIAVQALGFQVLHLLPGQAALAEWAGTEEAPEGGDLFIADIGFQTARLLIVRGKKIMLSRTVLLGGKALTEALTAFPPAGQAQAYSAEEALRIQLEEGVRDPQGAHVGLVRPYLEKMVAEIRRSIDYYEGQKYSRPVAKVVFTGGGARLAGLDSFMSQFLKMPASFAKDDELTLGAARVVEDADYLNLLPFEIRYATRVETKKMSMRMAFSLSFIVLFFFVGWVLVRIRMADTQQRVLETEWREVSRINDLLNEIVAQQNFKIAAMKGDVVHGGLWKTLSRITPPSVVVEEMAYRRESGTLILRVTTMSDQNQAVKTVAEYMDALSATPFFKDASLVRSTQAALGERPNFEIRCLVKGGA